MKTLLWDFKPIRRQGIYSKISLENYHSSNICVGPSVSSSGLRRLCSQSPAHFYSEWSNNPNRIEMPDKKHFILGRALHMLILGEEFFSKLFCVQPTTYPSEKTRTMEPWSNRSNYAKAWRKVMADDGKAILTMADVDNLRGMATSLGKHPIVTAGALNGQIERSIFWIDKPTGLWLKARPDAIPDTSVDFVDLKTTTSVLWPDLQKAIAENGYHQQGALIRRAARDVLKIQNPTFTLVFVEKTPPWCVRIVTLKDNDLDRGERQNRMALDTIARCIKSKQWPGPGGEQSDAEYIEMPEWMQKRIDDQLEYGP